jgi:hypothetical protein
VSEKSYDGGLLSSSPTPIVMGIDQSYTGFAVTFMAKDGEPKYQTWVYKSEGQGIDRLVGISLWLHGKIEYITNKGFSIDDSGLEAPVKMSHSALISGELFAVVRLRILNSCKNQARYPLQIPPTSLKKYVTGKGTGIQKNQMLLQVYKKWSVEFDDDNAADSYGIARLVSGRADTAYEKEVSKKLFNGSFRDK